MENMPSSPECGFVWILRVVYYFPVLLDKYCLFFEEIWSLKKKVHILGQSLNEDKRNSSHKGGKI